MLLVVPKKAIMNIKHGTYMARAVVSGYICWQGNFVSNRCLDLQSPENMSEGYFKAHLKLPFRMSTQKPS
jgi:hypothetical protein